MWIDEDAWTGDVVIETNETDATVALTALDADGKKFEKLLKKMAERVGFEPTEPCGSLS